MRDRLKAGRISMTPERQPRWWRRSEWSDVVLVILAVTLLLMATMELWLPHYGPQ